MRWRLRLPPNFAASSSTPFQLLRMLPTTTFFLLLSIISAVLIQPKFAIHHVRRSRGVVAGSGGEPSAFDLLRLEQQLDFMDPRTGGRTLRDQPRMEEGEEHAGRAENAGEEQEHGEGGKEDGGESQEEMCRKKCNTQLRMGLDMVKAHSAFGSIGVPSVIDEMDLQLFCRIDAAHDQCLIGCGYQIQFSLRDFLCKRRRDEMASHLDCYAHSSAQLKQQCGAARCGPYTQLELTMFGVGQRCRTLICDIGCMQRVLAQQREHCRDNGRPAARFLIVYSRLQVALWLREMLGQDTPWQSWPRSCARLLCADKNAAQLGAQQAKEMDAGEAGWSGNCSLPRIMNGTAVG